MILYGVRIFVDDVAAARAFYQGRLGLEEDWSLPTAFGVKAGQSVLIIEQEDPAGEHADLIGRFVGVSLAVEDIDARYQDLRAAGVIFTGPPQRQDWGGTLAHFKDPAGNTLTLLG